ncbi:MAG: HIT family hydrolase [candidate division Zixibacteria bacterium SM23_73_3]|nr:MAG: HIT family hydrolase [candidate division Zixibacteria bacterium SM23_73_3]
MERLWAPWREKFILCERKPGCFLCRTARENQDRRNLILFRGEKCFVILNRYPYNNGHLMIAPFRHVGKLEQLKEEELNELGKISQLCVKALKSGLKPQGINLGMNLGKVSGAGVAGHIHLHIVPRWQGDTNFMPILAETKLISVGLSKTYRLLKKELQRIDKKHSKRRSAGRRLALSEVKGRRR